MVYSHRLTVSLTSGKSLQVHTKCIWEEIESRFLEHHRNPGAGPEKTGLVVHNCSFRVSWRGFRNSEADFSSFGGVSEALEIGAQEFLGDPGVSRVSRGSI